MVPTIWIKTINNNQFTIWLGLITDLVIKNLISTPAITEDHQNQEQQKLQSIKKSIITSENIFLPLSVPNIKTHDIIYVLTDIGYSDLTEKFPVQSSQDNNYLLGHF